MNVTREDLNPCTVKLVVVCTQDEVKDGFEKAIKQLTKKIRLPGFRPGNAPRAMVEPMLDPREVHNEAADQIVRKYGTKAIDDQELKVDGSQQTAVEMTKLEKDPAECEFALKVPLPPIVGLGEYTGLPVERPSVEVTDEEVDYQIDELRRRKSTRESITDRGIAEGDVAVVNVKLDGEGGEGRTFMTVAGQTFPQLDEALMGMKVEEMKHAELDFPENFQEKDWAGKKLTCTVTVNSLSSVKMPELDEAFAKSLKTENVDDLRARLKETITGAKEEMVREIVNERLLDELLTRSEVEVSDNMWESLAVRRLQDVANDAQRAGKTVEQYAEESGMTVKEMIENWREKAKVHVKRALLIREVFTAEKMKIDNGELNVELHIMAQEYEMAPEELLTALRKNHSLEELHFRAIARKVGDFLLEKADIREAAMA